MKYKENDSKLGELGEGYLGVDSKASCQYLSNRIRALRISRVK